MAPLMIKKRCLRSRYCAVLAPCKLRYFHHLTHRLTAIKNPCLQVRRNILYGHSTETKQDRVMRLSICGIVPLTSGHYKWRGLRKVVL